MTVALWPVDGRGQTANTGLQVFLRRWQGHCALDGQHREIQRCDWGHQWHRREFPESHWEQWVRSRAQQHLCSCMHLGRSLLTNSPAPRDLLLVEICIQLRGAHLYTGEGVVPSHTLRKLSDLSRKFISCFLLTPLYAILFSQQTLEHCSKSYAVFNAKGVSCYEMGFWDFCHHALADQMYLPAGVPFINGAPQNTFVPGLLELAVQKKVLIGGDDFKSGQTKMKSVLVDFLVGAGIKPTSIVSYNHLGNNDGMNLSAPQTFRSKEISKSNVVDDMVASNSILYAPGIPLNMLWKHVAYSK